MRSTITHTTRSSLTLHLRTPRAQAEIVGLELAMLYEDRGEILRFVASCVVEHDGEGEEGEEVDALTALDSLTSPDEQLDLAVMLLDACRPPADHLDDVTALSRIIHSGGCQCRICSGRIKGRDPLPHELSLCRYGETTAHAFALYRLTAPHTSANLLHEHPALTSIATAIRLGESQAADDRRKERERKGEINRMLGI